MTYRLICVYENKDTLTPSLRIEVNYEGGKASLAPFIRKVTIEDLYEDFLSTNEQMFFLLNHSGFQKQPFKIEPKLLTSSSVRMLLLRHPWNYFQNNGKGSAKKIVSPIKGVLESKEIPIGTLLHGELYVKNLKDWKSKIEVKFRYKDSFCCFYPQYSSIPYITHDKNLFKRDKEKEKCLLETLGDEYDWKTGTLSLFDYDVRYIKKLMEFGWKVYVSKQNKTYSSVYMHSDPSGIVWFSTENVSESNIYHQLLDGFLFNRNFQESNGEILLYQKKDVEKLEGRYILEDIIGSSSDMNLFFRENKSLNENEKSVIESLLSQRIKTNLRDYQKEGVFWLQENRKNNRGCLLADEMGLGKTIQIIAHLCCVETSKKHLIVLPTSLVSNWQKEVSSFAPQLMKQLLFVSYDMLRIHLEEYEIYEYDTIVIDEAQIIKNRQTQKYKAVENLKCFHRIMITGTPIENSIDELWSHFFILMPESKSLYRGLHSKGICSSKDFYIALTSKILKPFILRREKKQVLSNLPSKIEKTIFLELSDTEKLIYQRVHQAILQAISSGIHGRVTSIVLEALLRLRQVCVSSNMLPSNLSANSNVESSKLKMAIAYIDSFKLEGHKVLVFSQFVSALREMEKLLAASNIQFVTLYGNTRDRDSCVNKFQHDEKITVFLISLKAGGVGLNLTSADRVILLDDWWNPAVEEQAMDRSHRIGQLHNVLVIRLVCKDTIEEKILQLQNQKRNVTNMFNVSNEKLTFEEIKMLLE